MKRFAALMWVAIILCTAFPAAGETEMVIDYDLSVFNRNMTYSQMIQVINAPEDYQGMVFRLKGIFNYSETLDMGRIIFTDRSGCCEVAVPFFPEEALVFPDDYPPLYSEIMITARFTVDPENQDMVCCFTDAVIEQE